MSCFEKWDIVRWPLHGSLGSKQWMYGAFFDHDPFCHQFGQAEERALIIISRQKAKWYNRKHHIPDPGNMFRSIPTKEMEFVAKGGELLADRRARQLSRRIRGV